MGLFRKGVDARRSSVFSDAAPPPSSRAWRWRSRTGDATPFGCGAATHDLAYQVRPADIATGERDVRAPGVWSVVMTYRASPRDGAAWVTGASSGIGRGVALELARRGYVVVASARRAEELQTLVREAQGLGGRIEPAPLDVTDRDATAKCVAEIEARQPIALAFLNAGSSFDDPPGDFGGAGFHRTFELNVFGVANGLNPLMRAMRKRGRGQIAINGSLVGRGFLPGSGAYGASKAAVIHLAASAKFIGDRAGLTVQIVNPGFVRTPLTADSSRPMPGIIACEDAARRICDGFERGGFEIAFPRRLAWLLKALNLLPFSLYFALVGRGASKRG
jgi:NAD(P)-dependent dehydrogenase (short-subunit alcohol dehydrogenase family)